MPLKALRGSLLGGTVLAVALGFATDNAFASYTAAVDGGGTLRIVGNSASDKLVLAPTPDSVVLDVGDDGTADFTFARSAFNSVQVEAGGGADEVRILNASVPLPAVSVDGGAGNDTLLGGNGGEQFFGGSGNDFVDGNIGADSARLGPGNDTFQWDPGDGSDAVDGEAGSDSLAFNGSNIGEKIELASNGGTGARLTRDIAAITMDLQGVEDVNVRALGGADTVTVDDLSSAGVTRTDVDLAGFDGNGDAAADNVVVNGTEDADDATVSSSGAALRVQGPGSNVFTTGDEAGDTVTFAGLGGDDTLHGNSTMTNTARAAFDGGPGTDHTDYDGTSGADTIGLARDGLAAVAAFGNGSGLLDSIGVEDLTVSGLGGADTIAGQNGIGQLTTLTEDGGSGNDILRGGDGADLLLGGTGNDFVDGNIGADTARLGAGNDTFQWDPGDGSDVVDGESGADALAFNGSNIGEQLELSADGAGGARFTRNVAAINMSLDDFESVAVRALGGADTMTVDDLDGTGITRTDVDLAGFDGTGDATADSVVVNGTPDADQATVSSSDGKLRVQGPGTNVFVAGGEPADVATFAGQDGDDSLETSVATVSTAKAGFDGGAGVDHASYDGSAAADTIGIARDGASAVAAFGASSVVLDNTAVEDLTVSGLGGDDTLAGQNGIGQLTALTLDGGAGNDIVRGGDGADLLLGGSGNDVVDGNIGTDTVRGGTGNDTLQWDPGDGSDVVDGEAGDDTLAFHGSNIGEQITLTPDGRGFQLFRNIAAVTQDVDNVEHAAVSALGGADLITVNSLAGTVVKSVDVDLAGFDGLGDGAADTVVANGTDAAEKVNVVRNGAQVLSTGLGPQLGITGSEPALDLLRVNTLGGDDSVTVAPDVSDLIASAVDLGADE
jgi:Ca2+-binding RTX toxin-like protein